jgi:hypothetical protein
MTNRVAEINRAVGHCHQPKRGPIMADAKNWEIQTSDSRDNLIRQLLAASGEMLSPAANGDRL